MNSEREESIQPQIEKAEEIVIDTQSKEPVFAQKTPGTPIETKLMIVLSVCLIFGLIMFFIIRAFVSETVDEVKENVQTINWVDDAIDDWPEDSAEMFFEEEEDIWGSEISLLDYTNDNYPGFVFKYPANLIVEESSTDSINNDFIPTIDEPIDTTVLFSNNDYSIKLFLMGIEKTSFLPCYTKEEINYERIYKGLVRNKKDNNTESYFYGYIIDTEYSPYAPWKDPYEGAYGTDEEPREHVACGHLGTLGSVGTLSHSYSALINLTVEIFNINKKTEILELVDKITTDLYKLKGYNQN